MNKKQMLTLIVIGSIVLGSLLYTISLQMHPSPGTSSRAYNIAIKPSAVTLLEGATQNFTILITSSRDYDTVVNLTIVNMPPGVSARIEPASLSVPASGVVTSTLIITGQTASVDSSALIIQAVSNNVSESTSLIVKVVNPKNATRIVHWSYDGFGKFTIDNMINKTLELGAGLAIVTLKDSDGNVYFGDFWNSNNATKINASELVEQFHAQGIMVIGDVGGLFDRHWISTHEDSGLFIWNQTTEIYNRSDNWIEPYYVYADMNGGEGYSQYVKDVLNATLRMGFDGVNFDDQLIYPYTEYTKPNCTFTGSPEFKDWSGIPQDYTGHDRYFTQWNETDRRFFNERANLTDLIAKEWVTFVKYLRPEAITTVYLNPRDHIAHGVRLSTYSELFDALYLQAYSNYVDLESLNEVRTRVSKPLYVFVYSILGRSYPPIFFNDENVMTEIADNAHKLRYDGIGIFTANKTYENGLNGFVQRLFSDYVSK